jgi:hypothetical protein
MPGMPIPEDSLAKMTPEQRAQLEAMMSSGAPPFTNRSCETAETLKRQHAYGADRGKNCKTTPVSSNGSKQVIQFSCETDDVKSDGTLTVDTPDSEHFNGTIVMHVKSQDRNMDMTQKISGKWISSDCGDVKPRAYPK